MIPKVIVQYWDQKKIPADVKSLMTSWSNKVDPIVKTKPALI